MPERNPMDKPAQVLGAGPRLLLLHGWGLDRRILLPLARRLAARWRVRLPDLPGYGPDSPKREGRDLFELTGALAPLLGRSSVVAGWSLGVLPALGLALDCPERVRAVALLNGSPCFLERPDWPCGIAGPRLAELRSGLHVDRAAAMERFTRLCAYGSPHSSRVLRELRAALHTGPTEVLLEGLELLRMADLRPTLSRLRPPLSLLLGGRDVLVPASVSEHVLQWCPRLRTYWIERAGHVPFLTHLQAVVDWLDELRNDGD